MPCIRTIKTRYSHDNMYVQFSVTIHLERKKESLRMIFNEPLWILFQIRPEYDLLWEQNNRPMTVEIRPVDDF